MRIRRDGGIGCHMKNPNPSNGSGSSLSFPSCYYFSQCPFTNGCKKRILNWSSLVARKATSWKILFGMRSLRTMQKSVISTGQTPPRYHSRNVSATGLSFLSRMGLLKSTITAQKQKQRWCGSSQVISFLLPTRIIVSNLSDTMALAARTLRMDNNAQKS
jgi:hypothetical protein